MKPLLSFSACLAVATVVCANIIVEDSADLVGTDSVSSQASAVVETTEDGIPTPVYGALGAVTMALLIANRRSTNAHA